MKVARSTLARLLKQNPTLKRWAGIVLCKFNPDRCHCPTISNLSRRQTTGDFLTSVTNPHERQARKGFEGKIPRTPDDFERYWRESTARKRLMQEIEQHEKEYPLGGEMIQTFQESKKGMQAKHVRDASPYVISIPMQIKYCTKRAYQRLWNDKISTVTTIVGVRRFSYFFVSKCRKLVM